MQSLALDGLDPVYGARPLKRLIQRQVVDNVANLIIDGKLHEATRSASTWAATTNSLPSAMTRRPTPPCRPSLTAREPVEPDSVE